MLANLANLHLYRYKAEVVETRKGGSIVSLVHYAASPGSTFLNQPSAAIRDFGVSRTYAYSIVSHYERCACVVCIASLREHL